MEVAKSYAVPAPRAVLWDRLMDVQFVASHLDGVEALNAESEHEYTGVLAVKMGPVRFKFDGRVTVTTRDAESGVGVLEASARDGKAAGGFKAELTMRLNEHGPTATQLELDLDTSFFGRIGEFGRPLIKKKIAAMMDDFAASVTAAVRDEVT